MNYTDFEKYYQKGGAYVLPIEVFNELFSEMESWKAECKQKENIIKEVREKVNKTLNVNSDYVDYDFGVELLRQELLEILDKENK